jgi:DnaJ domain
MVADPRDTHSFDAYAALELDPTATGDDVRRAYRRLARSLHPDANPGDAAAAERFRRVAEAHAVLADPIRRARYDVVHGHAGAVGPRAVRQGPAPTGNTAVRGPAARPMHRPREATEPPMRPAVDEWSFLGRLARWAVVAIVALLLLIGALATALRDAAPEPAVSGGVPGGPGFCQVPEGWIACELVHERDP